MAGDRHDVRVGDVSGQVAVGRDIRQVRTGGEPAPAVTEADLAVVRALVDELRGKVVAEAPPDKRAAALERVDELQEAITDEPDVSVMRYVRGWFRKNLPKLAGAVTGVIVHPLVGRVVEAAGDLVAGEFTRYFGDGSGG